MAKRYRKKLNAAGLRPLEIWVLDAKRPGFAAECRRQSLTLRTDPAELATQDWLDASSDLDGWQ